VENVMQGFSSEFITVNDRHRVSISCRDSFPTSCERSMAEEICNIIDAQGCNSARLVEIFSDRVRTGTSIFYVVSTDEKEYEVLKNCLNHGHIRSDEQSMVEVNLIEKSKYIRSDSYDHTAYVFQKHMESKYS